MIRSFDYLRSLPEIEDEVQGAVSRVLRSGRLILGPETESFEKEFARFAQTRYCVGVTSGTTALHLALFALGVGPGDEVITVANTCAPTVAAIRHVGADPVFVDVRQRDLLMDLEQVEARMNEKTRCVIPVHLWGHAVAMDRLLEICAPREVPVVEDCAQAHGTMWKGRKVGSWGIAGCFSFYPTKNIGAYGDAGAVVTNNGALAARLRRVRMYGYDGSPVAVEEGFNGRISEIQAAILRIKIRLYPEWLDRRLGIAEIYGSEIEDSAVVKPQSAPECSPTYHQYVVRTNHRDALASSLQEQGIETGIHYPVPVHQMPAYRNLPGARLPLPVTEQASEEILSLPIHEALTSDQARTVCRAINRFETENRGGP